MTNFSYLNNIESFEELKQHCYDAEFFAASRPDLSAASARKALEWMVKAIYVLKSEEVENASLFELVDNPTFTEFINNKEMITALHFIRKVGNNAVHNEKVTKKEGMLSLKNLHYFIGEVLLKLNIVKEYQNFNEELILENKADFSNVTPMISDLKIEPSNLPDIEIKPKDTLNIKSPMMFSEMETRKAYIDTWLREAGWELVGKDNIAVPSKAATEIKVEHMPNIQGIGFADYVLFGRDNKPLAVIEAKKTSVNENVGSHQAQLYAESLEKQYGVRPCIYYTNGYYTKFVDSLGYPAREVFGFHTLNELEYIHYQAKRNKKINKSINLDIAGRPYQIQAITKISEHLEKMHRKGLLVMATGTGKTRVSISLVELLKRNEWIKNVLFLADRTALVNQAKKNFAKLLPSETYCVLSDKGNNRDLNARIMFSTYQTMINYIDKDEKEFSIGRFDLIIVDEAHRSIFNKYKAIFNYFDSLLIGLTATPRNDVDKSTYEIFGLEEGIPNFHYEYDEAVKDGYLSPYDIVKRKSNLMETGIPYSKLSEEERKEIERADAVSIVGSEYKVEGSKFFRKVYNKDTVKKVLEDIMTHGLKVDNGDKIGKTIIFAYNHKHAQMIVDVFKEIFPELGDEFCQLIDNTVNYAQNIIDKFSIKESNPQIAVSVDMLDTGVDVPEILNLVFFKPVKSKIKFLQMIGRGTRKCENLLGPNQDKEKFYIFDYCGNFEYFETMQDSITPSSSISLNERILNIKLDIAYSLQSLQFQEEEFSKRMHDLLKLELNGVVKSLNRSRVQVRKNLEYVDKFSDSNTWMVLSKVDLNEFKRYISPLAMSIESDLFAKVFDLTVLNIQLSIIDPAQNSGKSKDIVISIARTLQDMSMIPAIKKSLDTIKLVQTEQFWSNLSLESIEKVRVELRQLIKYLKDSNLGLIANINVNDYIIEGEIISSQRLPKLKTYEDKILDYLSKHSDNEVINKIKNLEQLNIYDMKELERIFCEELGTKEDYENYNKQDKNFAVLVRSFVGLNQDAVNEKLGIYLNDNELNSKQQEFLKMIIDYIRQNGEIQPEILINDYPFRDGLSSFEGNIYIIQKILEYTNKVVTVG